MTTPSTLLTALRGAFGERVQCDVPLKRYTTARVGGPADALLVADTADDLVLITQQLWEMALPFYVLGGGSNVLVSDAGVRGVVVLNRSRQVRFNPGGGRRGVESPSVWAESGVNFGGLARRAAARGLSGLEWAAGIPGTLGGAVVGNAGAHGSDIAGCLVMAEILHRGGWAGHNQTVASHGDLPKAEFFREHWLVERFDYSYRSSVFKRHSVGRLEPGRAVVLAAQLRLYRSTKRFVQGKIDELSALRRRTQPPGASMGSMFKNPPGDYAGRLIEAAGLKGTSVGDAEISPVHANFFINRGRATAADIYALIRLSRQQVAEKFGVELELEIELLGEW